MESATDQIRSFLLAVGLHIGLIALIWFSAYWVLPINDSAAAGEPIKATLRVSAADIRRAQAAIKASPRPVIPEPTKAPPPQPVPEPRPQESPTPPQPVAQAPQDRPDTVDQQRISKLAVEQADQLALQEQEERHRQDQIDLTEDVSRQQLAERRQRLREYELVQKQREAAEKRTRLEEQRLQQLADARASNAAPSPPADSAPPPGNRGPDQGLLAKYKAAMLETADQNWNHLGARELTYCKVRFTQIPGGEVINVEFISCPYDAQGQEFVDRALRKTPMPYSGFEPVFLRKVELTFCYPREDCER